METMIIGPGAVGTLLGGLLRLKGHGVSLRGKKPPRETASVVRVVLPDRWMLVDGLRFQGPEDPVLPAEAILVTLGRHHVHAERRPDFARLIGAEDTPIAFFNCDAAKTERLAVPPARLRQCLSLMSAVKLQDNDVELASPSSCIVFEKSKLLARLFQDLASFGFKSMAVDAIQPYANSLLVTQLLFLPVAMCNTTLDAFLSSAPGRDLAMSILSEGFAAMERAGRELAPLPIMDPLELAMRLEKKPTSFEGAEAAPDRSYNSVLQSYLGDRPTEGALINRKIVEIASSAGLHLTWNWRILQKASRVSGLGFYRNPAELLKSLA
jgi:ketopantoate reductase